MNTSTITAADEKRQGMVESAIRRYDHLEDDTQGVTTAIQVTMWLNRDTAMFELDPLGVPCPVCDVAIHEPCNNGDEHGITHKDRRMVCAAIRVLVRDGISVVPS